MLVGARGNDAGGIQAGRAYLFLGPVTERLAGGADAIITGLPFEEIGRIVAPAGDLNNDGFDDIIVGSDIAGPGRQGRLYIFNGPVSGALSVTNASAVLTGAVPDDFFGTSVAAPGDLNGDGFADLVVGAPRAWSPSATPTAPARSSSSTARSPAASAPSRRRRS